MLNQEFPRTEDRANIVVLGLGYVGCVTATCLANLGHRVTGVDRDEYKVASIRERKAPFYEPGLEELIERAVDQQNLFSATSLAEVRDEPDAILICVGTPSERNGNLGVGQLHRAAQEIASVYRQRTKPLVVVVRSTVFPGTCEDLMENAFADNPAITVVSNPEFLREGAAVRDFVEPSLVVVGGSHQPSVEKIAGLYAPLRVPACMVSLRTAELIKYACNAFHAVKIGFANEIGALADRLGVDGAEVMSTLCQDTRLNISTAYLKPGMAFGGSCLPKDLRALTFRASRLDVKLPLLESVLPSNDRHLARTADAALSLPPGPIAVYGLAFKENTDDLRESPVVSLVEILTGKGRDLRIYDPHIQLDKIYGSNLGFLLSALPHIKRVMVSGIDQLLEGAASLVIMQKPSPEIAERLRAANIPTLDATTGRETVRMPEARS